MEFRLQAIAIPLQATGMKTEHLVRTPQTHIFLVSPAHVTNVQDMSDVGSRMC